MGGKINFLIGIAATLVLYFAHKTTLFWISLITTLIIFWTWGIMHNFAYGSARQRLDIIKKNKMNEEEVSEEVLKEIEHVKINITRSDAEQAPNFITTINIFATIVAIVFLIIGIIKLSS